MKKSLISKLFATTLAILSMGTAIDPTISTQAQTTVFNSSEVDQTKFVVAAIYSPVSNLYQLVILEQISTTRNCWSESNRNPTILNLLLLQFDFTGICGRSTDSNGYSIRMAGQDLGVSYSFSFVRSGNDLVMIGSDPFNPNSPKIEIGRTNGVSQSPMKVNLNSGWRLTKRTYQGSPLGHFYLTSNRTFNQVVAEGSGTGVSSTCGTTGNNPIGCGTTGINSLSSGTTGVNTTSTVNNSCATTGVGIPVSGTGTSLTIIGGTPSSGIPTNGTTGGSSTSGRPTVSSPVGSSPTINGGTTGGSSISGTPISRPPIPPIGGTTASSSPTSSSIISSGTPVSGASSNGIIGSGTTTSGTTGSGTTSARTPVIVTTGGSSIVNNGITGSGATGSGATSGITGCGTTGSGWQNR